MAISSVAICNLALDAAMCRSSISAIGEASAEGQACARHYEPALEAVLRSVHWNFARKQTTLSLLKDAMRRQPPGVPAHLPRDVPEPWLFEYAYPSDCLLARAVMPHMRRDADGVPISTDGGWVPPQPQMPMTRFLVSQDNDVSGNPIAVVLTNVPRAVLVYTCRISNTNLFDSMFVDAFTLYLASRLCRPLTGDRQWAQALFQQAEAITKQAAGMNGNEGPQVVDGVPDWVRVRGLAWDWGLMPGGPDWWGSPLPLTMVV